MQKDHWVATVGSNRTTSGRNSFALRTDTRDAKYRVKVYSFAVSGQWEDIGTGNVAISFLERLQALTILVRSEKNGGRSVLTCVVHTQSTIANNTSPHHNARNLQHTPHLHTRMHHDAYNTCTLGSMLLESKICPNREYRKQDVSWVASPLPPSSLPPPFHLTLCFLSIPSSSPLFLSLCPRNP